MRKYDSTVKKGLSRDKVVAAAIARIDEHGLDGLSMRGLAGDLGVEAMSLYRHVKNKADLLDSVHDALLSELTVPPAGAWADRARALVQEFRRLLFGHPRCVPLLASRAATTPDALDIVAAGVALFTDAGWAEDDALVAFQTLFCFAVGHAVFHTAGGEPFTDDAWARFEFDEGLETVLAGLRARSAG